MYESREIENVCMLGINLARLEKSVRCVSTLRKEHLQVLPHVSEYPDWKCLYAGYQSREIGKVCTLCISLAKRTTDLFKSFLTYQSTKSLEFPASCVFSILGAYADSSELYEGASLSAHFHNAATKTKVMRIARILHRCSIHS